MWIDTHCHPFDKAYKADREEMMKRAKEAGVKKIISVGYNKGANRKAVFDSELDNIWASVGVHPCDCADLTGEELAWMSMQVQGNDKIVAIGEAGLDFHHMKFSESEQEGFRKQIRLAKELDVPIIVHSRDAGFDTMRILIEEEAEKVVWHCFTYDLELADAAWSYGFYTAFGGVVTYPKASEVHEAAKACPLDLLLVETDAPYIATQKHRGKRNEIAWVVEVGEKVARLKDIDVGEIEKASTSNAEKLFGI